MVPKVFQDSHYWPEPDSSALSGQQFKPGRALGWGKEGLLVPDRDFNTTSWTVVLAAKDEQSAVSRHALNTLCETYWRPLYSYIRHRGHAVENAEDLTQEFFTRFLEHNYLEDVAPYKGKFRSFLLASLNHFLAKEFTRSQAQKRGGGQVRLPLDFAEAEQRYAIGPSHRLAPEVLFDVEWARTVIEAVLARLEAEFSASDKSQLFNRLKRCLSGQNAGLPYKNLAQELGLSEGALKVTIHRMRKRYGALLRDEIAKTVEKPEDIDGELRYLIEVIGS